MMTGPIGIFDLANRYEQLSQQGDPLVKLNEMIPWGKFRPLLRKALKKVRKSAAGRKPYDNILLFKMLVLQSFYNLSDAQVEFQIKDRLSFMRFLGLGLEDKVPDATTLWLFREALVQRNVIEKLFKQFDSYLSAKGFEAKLGSIIDASLVKVPKQRNNKEENQQIKAGKVPEDWQTKPNQLRQKDVQARWTKKNNQNYYGYKNHINVDVKHKLIRQFVVTAASQGDITCLETLLDKNNPDKKIWADKAYRSEAVECLLAENNYESRIHYQAKKGGWIAEEEKRWNYRYSKIRTRVEHAFGFITNTMKGNFIRTIGLARARFKIGMINLVYNFCRYQQCSRARTA
jgi:IS5 family transposase